MMIIVIKVFDNPKAKKKKIWLNISQYIYNVAESKLYYTLHDNNKLSGSGTRKF